MANKSRKADFNHIGIKPLITVDPTLPSFEGHPFFEKKANIAKKLLNRVGLPKSISPKSR
ncbi:hypothetical protein [Chitinophaga pinensis]|uniref:Uncharacterized protein n=1 Tax=Chitinophaga pinensis TaxID=79329 RepID=A0A5C6LQ32_9BACT|nr:hypothetical protein [Chitinophaga pinensis]TWV99272.1 hypothetical protein FEF09_17380 [Chitinophaga pinensis]